MSIRWHVACFLATALVVGGAFADDGPDALRITAWSVSERTISPDGDGLRDATEIAATFSLEPVDGIQGWLQRHPAPNVTRDFRLSFTIAINGPSGLVRTLEGSVDVEPPDQPQGGPVPIVVPSALFWDGRDQTGGVVSPGAYTLKLEALLERMDTHETPRKPARIVRAEAGRAVQELGQVEVESAAALALDLREPTEGALLAQRAIQVSGRVSVPDAVVTVNGRTVPLTGQEFSTTVLFAADGLGQELRVEAVAPDGRRAALIRHFGIDSTPPQLSGLTPSDGAFLAIQPAQLSGSVNDLTTCTITVQGIPCPVASGRFQTSVPLAEGANTALLRCVDSAGNATEFSLSWTYDPVPPAISDLVPPEGSFLTTASASLTGRVVDAYPARLVVDGADVVIQADGRFTTAVALPSEGSHAVEVMAWDRAGSSTTTVLNWIRDTTAPQVVIEAPAAGAFINQVQVEVRGVVTDANLESAALGGQPLVVGSDGRFTAQAQLVEGTNRLEVTARDRAGLVGSAAVDIVRDSTPPQVVIESPAPGAFVSLGQVEVRGVVTDANLESASLGGQPIVVGADGRFIAQAQLNEGTNHLEITARDRVGLVGLASVDVVRDSIPPQIVLEAPGPGAFISQEQVEVRGVVTDANLESAALGGQPIVVGPDGRFTAQAQLVEGANHLEVTARDRAGLIGSASVDVVRDTTAPQVVIEVPASGAVVNQTQIEVRGIIADVNLESAALGGQPIVVGPDGRFTAQAQLVEGANRLEVVARDRAGLTGSAAVDIVRDSTPPQVVIEAPAPGTFVSQGQIEVRGVITDANLESASFAGQPVVVGSDGRFVVQAELTEGTNHLEVTARDRAGLIGSGIVDVVRDSTPPQVVIEAPAAGIFINQVQVEVSGVVTDANLESASLGGQALVVGPDGRFTAQAQLPEGANHLVVTALDRAGQSGSAAVDLVRDTLAPVLVLTSPQEGFATREARITVEGTIDELNLAWVHLQGQAVAVAGGAFSAEAELVEGQNLLVAEAADKAGNQARFELHVTRNSDATAPLINVLEPLPGTYTAQTALTVRGTATDDFQLSFVTVNGVPATLQGAQFEAQVPVIGAEASWFELLVRAGDDAGNVAERSLSVRVDRTAPVVTLDAPFSGQLVTQPQVEVSGRVEDLAVLEVLLNGAPVQLMAGQFSAFATLTAGTNTLTVSARDRAGNVAQRTVDVECRLDTQLPQLVVLAPVNGAILGSRSVEVRGLLVGGSAASVAVNDQAATLTGSSFKAQVLLGEGMRPIEVVARNVEGDEVRRTLWVTIDTERPALAVLAPRDGSFTEAARVDVMGTVADDNLRDVLIQGVPTAIDHGSFASAVDLVPGANHILVVASDQAGNATTASLTVTQGTDPLAPRITLLTPLAGAVSNAADILVQGTIAGGAPFSVQINGEPAAVDGAAFQAQVALSEGFCALLVEASDASVRRASISLVLVCDRTAPVILDLQPASPAYVNGSHVVVSGRAQDDRLARVEVQGAQVPAAWDGTFTTEIEVPLGASTVTVLASDQAGNTAQANVQVERSSAPELAILSPLEGSWSNTATVLVTGVVRDDDLVEVRVQDVPATTSGVTFSAEVVLAEGPAVVWAVARDATGQETRRSVALTVDTAAPILELSSPSSGLATTAASVLITGHTTDPGAVLSPLIWCLADYQPDSPQPASMDETGSFTVPMGLKANATTRLLVYAVDSAMNFTTKAVDVIRDTLAPKLVIASPPEGFATSALQIEVACTAQDATLAAVQVNGSVMQESGGFYRGTVALAEGSNALAVVARDAFTRQTQVTRTVIRDTTGPRLTVVSPTNGSISRLYSVAVRGTAQDDRLAGVTLNGAALSLSNGAFEGRVDLVDGPNTLVVEAWDNLGNRTTTSINVLRTDAPELTVIAPGNPSFTNKAQILVQGTVSDSDLAGVMVGGAPALVVGFGYVASVLLQPGLNTIVVEAADLAGHLVSKQVVVTYETTSPVVAIVSPADGTLTRAGTIEVRGTVVEDALYRVMVGEALAAVVGQSWSASVPLLEGPNAVRVVATDRAYNETTAVITIVRDQTLPALQITAPAPGLVTAADSVTVSGTASDANGVGVQVGGAAAAMAGENWTVEVALQYGANTLEAVAADLLGNVSRAQVVVTRDPGAPVLSVTHPTPGVLLGAHAVVVEGTALDANLSSVLVQGQTATLDGAAFTAVVSMPEGAGIVAVLAADADGHQSSVDLPIIVDTLPPVVSVATPSEGALLGARQVTVSGQVQEPNLESLTVGGVPATLAGASFTAQVELQEGPNTVRLEARDRAGHLTGLDLHLSVDTGSRLLSLTVPPPGGQSKQGQVLSGQSFWKVRADCPMPCRYGVGVAVGERIFLVGGYNVNQYSGTDLGPINEYQVSSNTWTTKTTRIGRWAPGACALNGKVYVLGGLSNNAYGVTLASAHCYAWNPTTDSFAFSVPSLRTARGGLGAVELDGNVYAIGGLNGSSYLSSFEVLEPGHTSWQKRADLPTARAYLGAVALAGRIHAIGGTNGTRLATHEVYSPTTNSWSPAAPLPVPRDAFACVTLGGRIYVIGGTLTSGGADVVSYDPNTDAWTALSSFPRPRTALAAAVAFGQIYVLGGYASGAPQRWADLFSPTRVRVRAEGSVTGAPPAVGVSVNGVEASFDGVQYQADVELPEGRAELTVNAIDGDGQSTTATFASWLDLTAPWLHVRAPSDGATVGATTAVVVSGCAQDVSAVSVSVAGVAALVEPDGGFEFPVSLALGQQQIELLARDALGSESTRTLTLTGAFAPPSIQITQPNDGAFLPSQGLVPMSQGWSAIESMPTPRYYPSVVELDGKVYVIGGSTSTGVVATNECLELATGQWSTCAPSPAARYFAGAVALRGRIYVVGGGDASAVTAPLGRIDEYDSVGNVWVQRASLAVPRMGAAVHAVGGKLYVIGGNGKATGSWAGTPSVEEFDPDRGTCVAREPMPTALWYAFSGVVNDRIVVTGGSATVLEIYHPGGDSWFSGTAMPGERRWSGGSAVLGSALHCVGGATVAYTATDEHDVYDAVSGRWSKAGRTPLRAVATAMVSAQGRLYHFGARQGAPAVGDSLEYVPSQDFGYRAWATIPSMLVQRTAGAALAVRDRLYVVGANPTPNRLDEYDILSRAWRTLAPVPSVSSMTGAAVLDGLIWVAGRTLNSVACMYSFNPLTGQWTARTPSSIVNAVGNNGLAALNGRLYFLKGQEPANEFMEYQPATGTWAARTAPSVPRYYISLVAAAGRLYAVGGSTSSGVWLTTVQAWDPVSGLWQSVASLPLVLGWQARPAATSRGLCLFGPPATTGGPMRTFFYDASADAWAEDLSCPSTNWTMAVTFGGVLYGLGYGAYALPYETQLVEVAGRAIDTDLASVECNGHAAVLAGSTFTATVAAAEGTNTVQATAIDQAGAQATAVASFAIDTCAPGLLVSTPLDLATTDAQVLSVYGLVDDRALAAVMIGGNAATVSGQAFSGELRLSLGVNEVDVVALDRAGNASMVHRTVTLATEAPTLWVTSPADASFVNHTPIEVRGRVVDSDLASVEVQGQPANVAGESFSGTASLEAGLNDLVVRAVDAASHATTLHVRVTLDQTLPVIALDEPQDGTVTPAEGIRVSGSVTEANLATATLQGTPLVLSNGAFSVIVPLALGDNPLTLIARDKAGNEATRQVSVRREVLVPRVTIVSPLAGSVQGSHDVLVTGEAVGEAIVSVVVNGVPAALQGTTYSVHIPLIEGSNVITALARDSAGHEGSATIQVGIDTVPPEIHVLVPAEGSFLGGRAVTVSGQVQDAYLEAVWVQDELASLTGQSFERLVLLAEGPSDLVVRARDLAGHESTQVVHLTVDSIAPVIGDVQPPPGTWTNATELTVSGTVQDPHLVSVSVGGVQAALLGGVFSATGVPVPAEGANVLTLEATDSAGNRSQSSLAVNRDTQPPVVSVEPATGTTAESFADIVVRFSDGPSGIDAETLSISVDGAESLSRFLRLPDHAYLRPTTVGWAEGEHHVQASIRDLAGNTTTVGSSFSVAANSAPFISDVSLERDEFNPAPNPYEPPERRSLRVDFTLSSAASVGLQVTTLSGGLVVERTYPGLPPGAQHVDFDGVMAPGVYLRPGHYRLLLRATDARGHQSASQSVFFKAFF